MPPTTTPPGWEASSRPTGFGRFGDVWSKAMVVVLLVVVLSVLILALVLVPRPH